MKIAVATAVLLSVLCALGQAEEVDIEVLSAAADGCVGAANGDRIAVHYTGFLADGTKFDSSVDRGVPLPLTLGTGQVIKGWEQGLLGTCVGEKRKLTIPPSLGYGSRGAGGVIPPDATLVFEVEMMSINGGGGDEL